MTQSIFITTMLLSVRILKKNNNQKTVSVISLHFCQFTAGSNEILKAEV